MRKILYILVVFIILSTGCSRTLSEKYYGNNVKGGEHIGLTLHGKYAENIPENYVEELDDVSELYATFREDAENIFKAVKSSDLSNYYSPYDNMSILDMAKNGEFAAETRIFLNEIPIDVYLSYNIEERDGRYEGSDPIYVNYFPEPIIAITFDLPNVRNVYNKVLYTIDGELVGEYKEWFMYGEGCEETVRDSLAEYYFRETLKIIGK